MSLKEIYEQINGDYDSVIGRLLSEDRVKKYLCKFVDYNMNRRILEALENEDFETAFRESHNLKGICANLSIVALGQSASNLTEALRNGKPEVDIKPLVDALLSDYDMTVSVLKSFL